MLISNEPIYVVMSREREDGPDAPWSMDFNLPYAYLREDVAASFEQVYGFFFNGLEDARRFMEHMKIEYSNLEFKVVDTDIYQRLSREI